MLIIFYVSVHPTDPTRLELIIPGEQHFYVRAVNAAERQRWLVALGSSKAGTLDRHKHRGARSLCISVFIPLSNGGKFTLKKCLLWFELLFSLFQNSTRVNEREIIVCLQVRTV